MKAYMISSPEKRMVEFAEQRIVELESENAKLREEVSTLKSRISKVVDALDLVLCCNPDNPSCGSWD